jgi:hypothetical protein
VPSPAPRRTVSGTKRDAASRSTTSPAPLDDISRSELLRLRLELAADDYHAAAAALWSHPQLRAVFPDYLFRIHSIIRASVPVMEAARDRAAALAEHDPVCAALAAYLAHHVPEERHHDDWLLDDLDVLGVPPAAVWARQPSPTVAALVGAQYYWIQHHHPIAVLGYIAVLEGTPPTEALVEEVRRATGLPAAAFRTFIKHARLDPHHRDDLNAALDAMPLTEAHEALVTVNAIETQHWLARSLRETLRDAR